MSYSLKFRGQPVPNVWDEDRLNLFHSPKVQAMEIQNLAMAQTREEIYDYFYIDEDLLNQPENAYDAWFFDVNFRRGRALGKQNATASLFKTMETNSAAALGYLTRFGKEEWQTQGPSHTGGAEIKVVLDNG